MATAQALGAKPLGQYVERLASAARIELTSAPADLGRTSASDSKAASPATEPSIRLSPREREVLSLLGEGCSNREIAERLFISEKTASVHVTHIYDKLGVSSRVEAALAGARLAARPTEGPKP